MKTDPAEVRQIEPELLQRLGSFITKFAFVENAVGELFMSMTGGEQALLEIVTTNVSQTTLTGWIRTLIDVGTLHHPGWDLAVREVLEDIDELRAERNALVHGLWSTKGEAGSVVVQTVRLERGALVHGLVVTVADLDHLIDRTLEVTLRLIPILKEPNLEARK